MTDSRDVRTFATEVKFLVDPALAAGIRRWARIHLEPDPHGSGPNRDEYLTTSVYFDTEQFDVFHRRGSFGRSKYRIRRYGAEAQVFLERKLREPTVLAKRRTMMPLTALGRLDAGEPNPSWSGHWFHARVAARRLRPVCQISYRRTARMTVAGGDIVRLTLDETLAAQRSTQACFRDDPGVAVIDGRQILELKFRHQTPALFKRLVEEFALTPQSASKYRFGMAATGQVPAAVPLSAVASHLGAGEGPHG
jgi:VTC domain